MMLQKRYLLAIVLKRLVLELLLLPLLTFFCFLFAFPLIVSLGGVLGLILWLVALVPIAICIFLIALAIGIWLLNKALPYPLYARKLILIDIFLFLFLTLGPFLTYMNKDSFYEGTLFAWQSNYNYRFFNGSFHNCLKTDYKTGRITSVDKTGYLIDFNHGVGPVTFITKLASKQEKALTLTVPQYVVGDYVDYHETRECERILQPALNYEIKEYNRYRY